MYNLDSVLGLLKQRPSDKRSYIYARVSNSEQHGDLERQIEVLQKAYPKHILVKDIASGVDFGRKGLRTILEQVLDGVVEEVVVLHRDRLARLGCDLLEFIFEKAGTKLVVHCKDEGGGDHDIASDLLAVTTVIVASHNGCHSAKNRQRQKKEAAGSEECPTKKREKTTTDVKRGEKTTQEEEL